MRLRAEPLSVPFELVLVEPEIPPNTGNVARLSAATGSPLHLVGKLGFRIDEQAVRRAGLDYWPHVQLRQHADFTALRAALSPSCALRRRLFFFTAHADKSLYDAVFLPGDVLVFGKESVGLDQALMAAHPDAERLAIPTLGPVRSLNLANTVSIALFEALRQNGAFEKTFSQG